MSESTPFKTLRQPVSLQGIGLHSGQNIRICLHPAKETGIVFRCTDMPDAPPLPASIHHVVSTTHATTLEAAGVQVSTTEHLLAALWTLGVTNCRVELSGPEVPILDGSAQGWCRLIGEAGLVDVPEVGPRPIFVLRKPVWVSSGSTEVLGLPHHELRVSVAVDFGRDYLGPQAFDAVVDAHSFGVEVAPARTFTMEEWIEPLRAQGLIKGGNTDNAIVLGADGPSTPFRYPDEVARHKALDVVGDIALLFGQNGGILLAHLIAVRAGHPSHRAWMTKCLQQGALRQIA